MALVLTSCSQVGQNLAELNGQDGIFSNRPQNFNQYITVIKLPQPPLLSRLDNEGGKKVIRKDLAAAIELEQNELIAKLQKISPDIKVLFRYRLVLNAVAIVAPLSAEKAISALPKVVIERPQGFGRPTAISKIPSSVKNQALADKNSVTFIAADKAHTKGIRGQGMKVAVLDTGVDYTHAMLGGPGTVQAFKDTDPAKTSSLFPNQKVVGGVDLVGTTYNAASDTFTHRIPQPDDNPIDEGGHGTHVAGTIAGTGDNKITYSGVAPDALIYAVKVFGAEGSTSDEVVIAGLEFSADPNKDLDLSDQLHVVNMSLGSEYGSSHVMYSESIRNLSEAGTVVVASAGNAGAKDFITGSPAAVDAAFSVAASIDDMIQNWQFRAAEFTLPDGQKIVTEAVEGPSSTPIEEVEKAEGELVYIGLADVDLTEELKTQLKGKVALIDRGKVAFVDKLKRAEAAGAVAAVVANNQAGEAFPMGGDGKVQIPAIMVRMDVGQSLKDAMAQGAVVAQFITEEKISKPDLIDTLTDFSSKGPRSFDAILKPEISAPGQNIISAAMGEGNEGVMMSGTSMAGPHVAGVMALMKQNFPHLKSEELKAIVMGTAKSIAAKDQKTYPLSQQGAGRVQVDKAIESTLTVRPAALSLGLIGIEKAKTLSHSLTLKNISKETLALTLKFEGHPAMTMAPITVNVDPMSEKSVHLRLTLNASALQNPANEVDGFIKAFAADKEVFRVATLALVRKISNIQSEALVIHASSANEAADSVVDLYLKNLSPQAGDVLLFNKIALDTRKPVPNGVLLSRSCDLQAAGYRLNGTKLQIAVKVYEAVTSWHMCEVSVLIDTNGDEEAEQEIAGVPATRLEGMPPADESFKSILLDATEARRIRAEYEATLAKDPTKEEELKTALNYTPAVQSLGLMTVYNHSTIAILEVETAALKTRNSGALAVKIAVTSAEDYNIQKDDFLSSDKRWRKIDISEKAQSFLNLPPVVQLNGGESRSVELIKGHVKGDLLVLLPHNQSLLGTLQKDQQMVIPKVSYQQ